MNTFVYNPGGNLTALVENLDGSILKSNYAEIANSKMESLDVEQVAFIELEDNMYKCAMMGGELCINAIRSLGKYLYDATGAADFSVMSSGLQDVVSVNAESWVTVTLPKNFTIKKVRENLSLVEMQGIAHFVLITDSFMSDARMRQYIDELIIAVDGYPAIGLINVVDSKIKPLVYVKDTNTFIFETGCASGSIAAALVRGESVATIVQPSGYPYLIFLEEDLVKLSGVVKS